MSIPGSNIRLLRQQLNLSQRALATAADMDVAGLSRLESGKAGYSREAIERIAKALGVSVGVLFSETAVVEAAVTRVRQIPVLSADQLAAWTGPDNFDFVDEQECLFGNLNQVSRFVFAWRVEERSNAPVFDLGDDLVFDANRQPQMGDVVLAQDATKRVVIGRLRELTPTPDGSPVFELVPYDAVYPAASSGATEGLRLRGTLVEIRKYVR